MSIPRRILAFLELAEQDIDAGRTLAATSNRYAAYHCQQAIEKLTKAVMLHRGLPSGTEHRLDILVDMLTDGDVWKNRLRPLEVYSPYATTFRYPTPGGRIVPAPLPSQVMADLTIVAELVQQARRELQS